MCKMEGNMVKKDKFNHNEKVILAILVSSGAVLVFNLFTLLYTLSWTYAMKVD